MLVRICHQRFERYNKYYGLSFRQQNRKRFIYSPAVYEQSHPRGIMSLPEKYWADSLKTARRKGLLFILLKKSLLASWRLETLRNLRLCHSRQSQLSDVFIRDTSSEKQPQSGCGNHKGKPTATKTQKANRRCTQVSR